MRTFTLNARDLEIFAAKMKEEEREECAKLLENLPLGYPKNGPETIRQCVRAIRGRNVSDRSYAMLTKPAAYKEGVWDQQVIK